MLYPPEHLRSRYGAGFQAVGFAETLKIISQDNALMPLQLTLHTVQCKGLLQSTPITCSPILLRYLGMPHLQVHACALSIPDLTCPPAHSGPALFRQLTAQRILCPNTWTPPQRIHDPTLHTAHGTLHRNAPPHQPDPFVSCLLTPPTHNSLLVSVCTPVLSPGEAGSTGHLSGRGAGWRCCRQHLSGHRSAVRGGA